MTTDELIDLIVFATSLIPLMVTRLLISLRKASHPEAIAEWNINHFTGFYTTTTTTVTIEDHSALSDIQKSSMFTRETSTSLVVMASLPSQHTPTPHPSSSHPNRLRTRVSGVVAPKRSLAQHEEAAKEANPAVPSRIDNALARARDTFERAPHDCLART